MRRKLPPEVVNAVRETVVSARNHRRMSQSAVARKANMTQVSVSVLESDQAHINLAVYAAAMDALDYQVVLLVRPREAPQGSVSRKIRIC